MAEFRKRRETQMREQLGATEDEWKVLQPRIEKVQQLQRQGMAMRFGRMFGRRGRRPGGERRPEGEAQRERPDVAKKAEALQSLLEDKASAPGAIKAALGAFRKAQEKTELALAAARKELRDVVTMRQEARFVLMGLLK